MTKIDPITWAKALVSVQDIRTAYGIIETHSRSHIGTDGATKNPHADFYKKALEWMKKNHKKPASDPH